MTKHSLTLGHTLQEFPCEICGGAKYRGRREFERHFREWKHQNAMRALGIPNNKNFFEITKVADAQELWENIQVVSSCKYHQPHTAHFQNPPSPCWTPATLPAPPRHFDASHRHPPPTQIYLHFLKPPHFPLTVTRGRMRRRIPSFSPSKFKMTERNWLLPSSVEVKLWGGGGVFSEFWGTKAGFRAQGGTKF